MSLRHFASPAGGSTVDSGAKPPIVAVLKTEVTVVVRTSLADWTSKQAVGSVFATSPLPSPYTDSPGEIPLPVEPPVTLSS